MNKSRRIILRRGQLWSLLFLLFLSTISCNSHWDDECDSTHKVKGPEIIKKISIPLESQQYNHADLVLIKNKNDLWLYGFDRQNHTIDIFNFNEKKYYKTIRLAQEGVNKVVAPSAFYVNSLDSIFLANDLNQIYLIDSAGRKINEWDIHIKLPDSLASNFANSYEVTALAYAKKGMVNLPFYYNKRSKSFFFRMITQTSNSLRNMSSILDNYKLPIVVEISSKDGTVLNYHGAFPNNYKNSDDVPLELYNDFSIVDNKVAIQFQYSPKIWINGSIKCDASNFSTGDVSLFASNGNLGSNDEFRPFNIDECYVGLINDVYRKQLLVVFQHSQHKNTGTYDPLKMEADFSIIQLNYAGETLGEIKLDNIRADFFNIFPHPKGILISLENEFNDNNKEDAYEFLLIKNPTYEDL